MFTPRSALLMTTQDNGVWSGVRIEEVRELLLLLPAHSSSSVFVCGTNLRSLDAQVIAARRAEREKRTDEEADDLKRVLVYAACGAVAVVGPSQWVRRYFNVFEPPPSNALRLKVRSAAPLSRVL